MLPRFPNDARGNKAFDAFSHVGDVTNPGPRCDERIAGLAPLPMKAETKPHHTVEHQKFISG